MNPMPILLVPGILLALAGFFIDLFVIKRLDGEHPNRKLLKTAGTVLVLGSLGFSGLAWIPELNTFAVFGFILIAVFLGILNTGLLAGAAVSVVHAKPQSLNTWCIIVASLLSMFGFALIAYSRLEPYFA